MPQTGAVPRRRIGPGASGPAGVEEHGGRALGFPRNLRDLPVSLEIEVGEGEAAATRLLALAACFRPKGANTKHYRGQPERPTERGGRAGRSRSVFIVPEKRGNCDPRGPRGGKEDVR